MSGALADLQVLDLSEGVAGQFCSRLMADYGALVTLVEPTSGSVVRKMQPFREDSTESLLFFHLNTGKHSISIDRDTTSGRRLVASLASGSDVILVPAHGGSREFAAVCPTAVVCVVSDFGEDGALSAWQGSEMIHQALSGVMFENGKANGKPLYGCGRRSYYAAGVAAYISILTALLERRRSGKGQMIDISVAETAASMNYCRATQFSYNGTIERRGDVSRSVRTFLECRDGWIAIFPEGIWWRPTCEALGATQLLDDPGLADDNARQARWPEVVQALQALVAHRSAEDAAAAVRARGGIAAKALSLPELWTSDHLRARGYWQETTDGSAVLGPSFRMSRTPRVATTPPPRLGRRSADVLTRV
jgi:crotonobetainyl-CoA:carnitine CoA-transferase CaiB-like acyl-CoA transferase